jgi:hypothetical protein
MSVSLMGSNILESQNRSCFAHIAQLERGKYYANYIAVN